MEINKLAVKFFKNLSETKDDPKSVKLANNTDFTDIDAKFILNYVTKQDSILDLGSGTGLIVNRLYPYVKKITAVEYFPKFSKYIIKVPNIEVINEDIFKFNTKDTFNLVTCFGLMHYFSKEESEIIYIKCFKWLKKGGKLIVKNQFCVKDNVEISGYSQEQKDNYYASYRTLQVEKNILETIGFKNIEFFDIYPKEANRWKNTHFYAIVAEK